MSILCSTVKSGEIAVSKLTIVAHIHTNSEQVKLVKAELEILV